MRVARRDDGLTPADLFDRLTPTQLIAAYFQPPGRADGSDVEDRLDTLSRLNHERGERGQRPLIPSWV